MILEYQDTLETRKQFTAKAKDTQQFFKELNVKENKFNTIANYFGRGLFSNLNQPESPEPKKREKSGRATTTGGYAYDDDI